MTVPSGPNTSAEPRRPIVESVFLAMRAGRQATVALASPLPSCGGVAVFPVVVEAPGVNGTTDCRVVPLATSLEPGSVVAPGVTPVDWSASYGLGRRKWSASGTFYIGVGVDADALPAATMQIDVPTGAPVPPPRWYFPMNRVVAQLRGERLRRRLERTVFEGEQALERELWQCPTVLASMQRARVLARSRASDSPGAADADDLLAAFRRALVAGAVKFSQPVRPDCTWLRWIRLNAFRDITREDLRNRFEPAETYTIRAWIAANGIPEGTPAAEVRMLHARSTMIEKALRANPGRRRDEVECDLPDVIDPNRSRWSLRQFELALAPAVTVGSLDPVVADDHAGLIHRLGVDDVRLSSVGERAADVIVRLADDTEVTAAELAAWGLQTKALDRSDLPVELLDEAMALMPLSRRGTARVERRLLARFAEHGERWENVDDRARIKERAAAGLLLPSGGLRDRALLSA